MKNENAIFTYLHQMTNSEVNKNKKIIIYGAGAMGRNVFAYLNVMGKKVACFADMDEHKQEKLYLGIKVISPYQLMYYEECLVILAIDEKEKARELLEGLGLKSGKDYFDMGNWWSTGVKSRLIDPLLGWSRYGDEDGFEIWNENAEKSIMILGGSTTDPKYSGITSWGGYLYDLVRQKHDYTIYNGGMIGYYSGQEFLKFVRDGMEVMPDVLCVMSGVNDAVTVEKMESNPLVSRYTYQFYKKALEGRSHTGEKLSLGLASELSSAETWLRSMRMIYAVCKEFAIKCYIFLQPTYGVGGGVLTILLMRCRKPYIAKRLSVKRRHFTERQ